MRLIYLHGFASSPGSKKASFFRERIPSLEVPDLAAGDFENLTISSQLQVVEGLTRGEPVALIGSSLGGYLAALYAVRHPETLRLVLMAPAFGFARRWDAGLEGRDWRKTRFRDFYHYGEKRTRRLSYAFIEDALEYEDDPDFKQPALIFHGTRDDAVPAQCSIQFAAAHPNAHLHLLDSDHELLDALEVIWQASRPFLLP